ncbi:hypothetical protein Scep_008013 [Stephania cephalantha]|uniref:Branched-chain-amino-acid aminotransferase n=1 Tax=Stephania cephalantha TaxID=152367 RepID=A0AAP0KAW9_9MAGN
MGLGAKLRRVRRQAFELADVCWDDIGFGIIPTDYMYVMRCPRDGEFSNGTLEPYGNIELSPSSGVLNYGQGLFEGLKAYRKEDGSILLFRPEENGVRMRMGAERLCMPAPTVEQFVDAIKATVLANKRWVPPPGKGSLYIRPLLMGTGAVLELAPAPEYTFLIYVSPVGNYFKESYRRISSPPIESWVFVHEGLAPINLVIQNDYHRATPGGTGGIKTIGNYASVLKAQSEAKEKGYSDVLYLDSVHKKYLEEVSSCNVFVVKDNTISTPAIRGTILPGITRKSIIDVAVSLGFQVEERLISVEEVLDADEVFCTGTAVVVSPVGSITYHGKRIVFEQMVGDMFIVGYPMEMAELGLCPNNSTLFLQDYKWVLPRIRWDGHCSYAKKVVIGYLLRWISAIVFFVTRIIHVPALPSLSAMM